MPKLTWIDKRKKINYVGALIRAYKDAAGVTSAKIAEVLNYQPDSVRRQIGKPVECWRAVDIIKYCDYLQIPMDEMLEAFRKSM